MLTPARSPAPVPLANFDDPVMSSNNHYISPHGPIGSPARAAFPLGNNPNRSRSPLSEGLAHGLGMTSSRPRDRDERDEVDELGSMMTRTQVSRGAGGGGGGAEGLRARFESSELDSPSKSRYRYPSPLDPLLANGNGNGNGNGDHRGQPRARLESDWNYSRLLADGPVNNQDPFTYRRSHGTNPTIHNNQDRALSLLGDVRQWDAAVQSPSRSIHPIQVQPPLTGGIGNGHGITIDTYGRGEDVDGSFPRPPSSAPTGNFRPFSLPSSQQTLKPDGLLVPSPSNRGSIGGGVMEQATHHLSSLQNLLNPLVSALQEVEGLKKEVAIWKQEWATADKETSRLKGLLADNESNAERVPNGGRFTALLLDGDGLIFEDSLIQQGFKGGQAAAKTLLSALPALINKADHGADHPSTEAATLHSGSAGVPGTSDDSLSSRKEKVESELGSVVVQLFVNKSGLGTTLVKAGSVPSWGVFDSFWQGFSASHELFTVIDVGTGKEASDAKIKDFLRLYVRNAQCEHVVLGATHDNGYAPLLSSLETESRFSKLLLLKGYKDIAPELQQYSSRIITIPGLFRTSKVSVPVQSFSAVAKSEPTAVTTSTGTKPSGSTKKAAEDANIKASKSSGLTGLEVDRASDVDSVEVIEWSMEPTTSKGNKKAKKGNKASSPGTTTTVVPAKADTAGGLGPGPVDDEWKVANGKRGSKKSSGGGVGDRYQVNGSGRGGGKVSKNSVRNLINPRPCHAYYLSQYGCKSGYECDYGHDYDLDESQLEELGKLAKEMPCPYIKNNKCRFSEDDCIYGHRCPRGDRCKFGDSCRFKILPNGHGELGDDSDYETESD